MAPDTEDPSPAEPPPCQPCRGTGQVVSGLGGGPHAIPCPWCDGTGRFVAEHDAQAAWRAAEDGESP